MPPCLRLPEEMRQGRPRDLEFAAHERRGYVLPVVESEAVSKKTKCATCRGWGTCPACDGARKIEDKDCARCHEAGVSGLCNVCKGRGWVAVSDESR
jgi:hypothetical protein